MSARQLASQLGQTAPSSKLAAACQALRKLALGWQAGRQQRHQLRRQREELASMNEQDLRDLGLSRTQLQFQLTSPEAERD